MRPSAVLALDIGTSSVRAALFDLKGRRVPGSFARRLYALNTDKAGRAELDPARLLRQARAVLKEAGKGSFAAVGVSCFWHSLMGVDAKGKALTPIYTWADARCHEDAAKLRREISEREVHAETGCMLRSSYWPAKLRWLQRTNGALFRRVRFWISPGDWVQWQMTGKAHCAYGMATGTGLFNPSTLDWSLRMLKVCRFSADRMLPIGDEPVSWQGVPWYPAIGDGAASNLGSGATHPGRGALNVGTSAALRVMKKGRVARAPFGLFAYRVDAERYLVGGAVSNAGSLHAWGLCELLLPDEKAIEKALAQRPLPQHGLTVLPFWTAERAPTWNDETKGAICGIQQDTTAFDLLQAITEASYLRLAAIAEMIAGKKQPRWIIAGGILNSPSSVQRLANVIGSPLTINPDPEASLRGAAVFALEKLGCRVTELKLGVAVRPASAIHQVYREEGKRQRALENLLGKKDGR